MWRRSFRTAPVPARRFALRPDVGSRRCLRAPLASIPTRDSLRWLPRRPSGRCPKVKRAQTCPRVARPRQRSAQALPRTSTVARSPCARCASANRRPPNATTKFPRPSSPLAATVARAADDPCAKSCRRPMRGRVNSGPQWAFRATESRHVCRRRGNRSAAIENRYCRCPVRA